MNGGVGLNSYLYFELVGPLSTYSEKYNYQLRAVEWIGKEKVYRIRFNTKPAFSLVGRFIKGYLIIAVSSNKLISVDVSGEFLWSSMFHERVFGTMHYEYIYYNDQPYLSQITTRYKKKNVEERTLLKVDLQNFNFFIVDNQSALDIQLLEKNPLAVADKNLNKIASMGINFEVLKNDLGFEESLWEQFQAKSGKIFWKYTDNERSESGRGRQNATQLVEEYKMFISSR